MTFEDRITPEREQNLERLATYLESLPEDYKEFDMNVYFDGNYRTREEEKRLQKHYAQYNGSVAKCGTAACAVGHGPSSGLFLVQLELEGYEPSWTEYAERVFIGKMDRSSASPDPYFQWLFADDWGVVDNHHWGAAARIRYLLDKREVPFEHYTFQQWYAMMYDDEARSRELVAVYAPYRVTRSKPLPKDFYTFEMLARFEEGKKLLEAL